MRDIIFSYFEKLENAENKDLQAFREGWNCCLKELDRQRAMKDDRKANKFLITDFLDDYGDMKKTRPSLCGVYHEFKKQVVTNGHYLLVHNNASYTDAFEGKIIDRNNQEITGQFPKYASVIPEQGEMIEYKGITKDDIKIICSQFKEKSFAKQKTKFVKITTDDFEIGFSVCILKRLESFFKVYPDAIVNIHSDRSKLTRTWTLKDKDTDDLLVFMPLCGVADDEWACEYSTMDKIVHMK